MAKKKAKKRFDPTAESGFPSRKAWRKYIRRRAIGQIRPGLNDIAQRRREERGASETRMGEINSLYGADLAGRQSGYDRLNASLQGLAGGLEDLTGDAQAGLQAALRQQADAAAQGAAQIGGANPGMDPQLAKTLAAYGAANRMGFAGEAAGALTRGAADISQTGVEQREAGLQEQQRHASVIDALQKERSDLRATLPEIIAQMRQQAIQEQLAIKQQGLAEDQFGETKRSNKAQERLSRRQIRLAERTQRQENRLARRQMKLNEDQLDLARQELQNNIDTATTEAGRKQAEGAAKRFESAVEWLSGYFKPTDRDKVFDEDRQKDVFSGKQWRKNRRFDDAFEQLSATFPGMSELEVMRVMATSPFKAWRKRAQARITVLLQQASAGQNPLPRPGTAPVGAGGKAPY